MYYIFTGIVVLAGLGAGVAFLRSFWKSAQRLHEEVEKPKDDAADELDRLAQNMKNMLWGMRSRFPPCREAA